MRIRFLELITGVVAATAFASAAAQAQSFYTGKTVRIVVGLAPGGGFDTYARLIGRHLGNHIPGNPTVIVDNMPGAGSLVMANWLYKVAKPDGLTIGHFDGALILGQAIGRPGIEFDAQKFEYLGAAAKEDVVCSISKASGITTIEQLRAAKTPVKFGALTPGATPNNAPETLKVALGLPIQVVSGYKGTSGIRLGVESGEVAGACWSWQSMRVTWRKALEAGEVVPVIQIVAKPFSDLPNVPVAINLATTDEARQLIRAGVQNSGAFARPLAVPPGTPADRVEMLRKALADTLKDPAFVGEADKANLAIDPATGEELTELVKEVFALNPALLAKLNATLFP